MNIRKAVTITTALLFLLTGAMAQTGSISGTVIDGGGAALAGANVMVEEVKAQIMELIGCNEKDIIEASAKNGIGVDQIFTAVIERIAAPQENDDAPPRALIFDSLYDNYRGAVPPKRTPANHCLPYALSHMGLCWNPKPFVLL